MTVEGIGAGHEGGLHPFQRALIAEGGVQRGGGTPGMVVVGAQLAESRPKAGEGAIREGLSGNLCRCTGYARIVDALRKVQESFGSPVGGEAPGDG